MGYMFPAGGQAGQSTEVTLGGYDWTPDMQVFSHDPRISIEIIGQPGPVIVPEPPYWFGKKARRSPFPLPREVRAKLNIPADVAPGFVKWQAANANGATSTGTIVVNNPSYTMVTEVDRRSKPQRIESLPCSVSGQIKLVSEVDQYQFTAAKSGLITFSLLARAMASPLNSVIEVRDSSGRIVADAADTSGNDTALTFSARAGEDYVVSVYDLDFRGDRSFVYQLDITAGPRVVTAIPAVGFRGETRSVEFIGFGIASGVAKLESLTREITFSAAGNATSFPYVLKTAHGECPSFPLHVRDQPQIAGDSLTLVVPCGVTGVLEERFGEDRYRIAGKKDEVWWIEASSELTGSLIDVSLAVLDGEGKLLARNDDRPESTDAELEFKVPADGDYQICVTDIASQSGSRAATYHLSIRQGEPDFFISAPQIANVPVGGKASVALKVIRRNGFQDPIDISVTGLPVGVTVEAPLQVAANQSALSVELKAAVDAAASAGLVEFVASAVVDGKSFERRTQPLLVAMTLKPPFSIDAEGKDDVTKWPRGTTFPAPVLIERDEGFTGDIMLEMTSRQGRHVQGISGPELLVAPDVQRILYPVYLPEWLETTRTSRMVVNGVAKVADPQGNVRYSVSMQKTRMGFLPTGALMKLSANDDVFQVKPGDKLEVPIVLDRSGELVEDVRLELCRDGNSSSEFVSAESMTLSGNITHAEFPVTISSSTPATVELPIKIRATLLKDGTFPVISEFDLVIVVCNSREPLLP